MKGLFFNWDDLDWIVMDDRMRRKQVWEGQLMNIKIEIKAGTQTQPHTHVHEQTGTVLQGTLCMRIAGEEKTLPPGSGYIIPPNVPHSLQVVGHETAIMLETFTPPREDLLTKGES